MLLFCKVLVILSRGVKGKRWQINALIKENIDKNKLKITFPMIKV